MRRVTPPMKTSLLLQALLLGMIGLGCQSVDDGGSSAARDDEDDHEQELALSDVPQAVKDAALAAVPGLQMTEAETELENGVRTYCIEGSADGKEYEIEISADGRVLEVETEDEEDDD